MFILFSLILLAFSILYLIKGLAVVTKYITKGWKEVHELYREKALSVETEKLLKYLEAVEKVKRTKDELEVIHLIEEHQLVREHLLTNHLKSKEVSSFEKRNLRFQTQGSIPSPSKTREGAREMTQYLQHLMNRQEDQLVFMWQVETEMENQSKVTSKTSQISLPGASTWTERP